MGRLVLLLATVGAAVATGSGDPAHAPIVFGLGGGNMVPYQVTIQPNGVVRRSGSASARRSRLPAATVGQLRTRIEQAHLSSRECPGTLPDVGSQYIRVCGRTVRLHGACEPRFTRVWDALAHAVGLRVG